MRIFSLSILIALLLLPFVASCRKEQKIDVASAINPKKMPSMTTMNVATFISDSGYTQYKIVTPIWYVYDEVDTPCWRFPKGLYLQKYDRKLNVIATVAADSAKYFKQMRIWRLDGNVEMHKQPKDLFLTQQLYWDERQRKIYSDSFIHIETATHILEGHGFVSDDRLITYRVIRPTGIFPVNQDNLHPGQSMAQP